MPRQNDDDELKAGFEALVSPYEDALFAGALMFTNNRADADDLLQELLLLRHPHHPRSRKPYLKKHLRQLLKLWNKPLLLKRSLLRNGLLKQLKKTIQPQLRGFPMKQCRKLQVNLK